MKLSEDTFAAVAMHGLLSRTGPGGFDLDVHPADALRAACWAYEMGRTMARVRTASDQEISQMFEEANKTHSLSQFMNALEKTEHREKLSKAKAAR